MSLKSERSGGKDRDKEDDKSKKRDKEHKKKDKLHDSEEEMKSGKSSKKHKKSDKEHKGDHADDHDHHYSKHRGDQKNSKHSEKKGRRDSSDENHDHHSGGMLKSMKEMMKDIKAKPVEYDDEREYSLFFEQMIIPLIHRMKTDLANEKPRDVIEYCMDWIDKEKRGENRSKQSKYEKLKIEEEEAEAKKRTNSSSKTSIPPIHPDPPKADPSKTIQSKIAPKAAK